MAEIAVGVRDRHLADGGYGRRIVGNGIADGRVLNGGRSFV